MLLGPRILGVFNIDIFCYKKKSLVVFIILFGVMDMVILM